MLCCLGDLLHIFTISAFSLYPEKRYDIIFYYSEPDYCATATCANGGTCVNTGGGSDCTCAQGWIGDTCQDLGKKGVLIMSASYAQHHT